MPSRVTLQWRKRNKVPSKVALKLRKNDAVPHRLPYMLENILCAGALFILILPLSLRQPESTTEGEGDAIV